jgi:hypothetical protein
MAAKSGDARGPDLEEALRAYFYHAGYFAVRGVPFRLEADDVTDIDIWLYERPAALTRRRLIVDAKNRKSPRVAERIVWTKGLQHALKVDGAIVATTDQRQSARRLAKEIGIILLDGAAVSKILKNEQLAQQTQLTSEELNALVKAVDEERRSNEWRTLLQEARASISTGFGVQSANLNLRTSAYFAEQTIVAYPGSDSAQAGLRSFYLTSALAAVSLDFVLADYAFQSQDERRQLIIQGIRFGHSNTTQAISTIRMAIGLARQYLPNGQAAAKQIENGFNLDAAKISAEIIADYVSRLSTADGLFNAAREIERASLAIDLPSYDELSTEARALLGVFLDFNGMSREKLATAWPKRGKRPQVKENIQPVASTPEPERQEASPPPSGTSQSGSSGPLFDIEKKIPKER